MVWDQGGPHPAAALHASQCKFLGGSHGQKKGYTVPSTLQAVPRLGEGGAGSGLRAQGCRGGRISKGKTAGINK